MKTIVCPAEYINDNGIVVNTIMTAMSKIEGLVVVYKINNSKFIANVKKFLEDFTNALDGKKIETPEDEIHRDDDLDVFKSFQESTQKEIGEITIDG